MEEEKLEQLVEAMLFYRGEPVAVADIAQMLKTTDVKIEAALKRLAETLANRGIRLVREGGRAGLATAPETREVIEMMRREELEGPLGKAGLETLAIVIYHGPLSRGDIEYIRGVNSASILRSLSMRGLIEKTDNPKDRRSFLYRATPELPAALGVASLHDLPHFEAIHEEIATALSGKSEEEAREREKEAEYTHESGT
ncbi:MAG: SMC-Scp complex subunit ScpB [Candidatus Paceibacteria bacterium]